LGIRCGGPRGDPGIDDPPLGESPMWDALMDGAESRLWRMERDGEFLVGRSVTGVVEPSEADTSCGKQLQVGVEPPSCGG
jgi:hypothetical protein